MKIICLGDSLTRGYGPGKTPGWVALLDEQTAPEWINAGVLGDSTAGMLCRLERDCLRHQPNRVLIMGGSNDFIHGVDNAGVHCNLATAAHQLMHQGIRPILGIPILTAPKQAAPRWGQAERFRAVNRQLADLRDFLMRFAGDFGCDLIDFQQSFDSDADSALLSDGLHPNKAGNERMARIAAEAMRSWRMKSIDK